MNASAAYLSSLFDLSDQQAYLAWRERKLTEAPRRAADLVVEIEDIGRLSEAEHGAILQRVRRCNMAVYQEAPKPGRDDKAAVQAFARAFGLERLDANVLADEDGITPLAVHREGSRARYIPYTERPIAWHTDGYYNTLPERAVRSVLLHCVNPAAAGGANRLMDYEILYIRLRDEDPAHIAALMRPDAMTIPPNAEEGLERQATPGPVFFLDRGGNLCMRYTARARNVVWSDDPAVVAAAAAIRRLLDGPDELILQHRLAAGQGLIGNNVLHTREPFSDDPASPRLLYRARFYDRVAGS